jgi:hypothetical protein
VAQRRMLTSSFYKNIHSNVTDSRENQSKCFPYSLEMFRYLAFTGFPVPAREKPENVFLTINEGWLFFYQKLNDFLCFSLFCLQFLLFFSLILVWFFFLYLVCFQMFNSSFLLLLFCQYKYKDLSIGFHSLLLPAWGDAILIFGLAKNGKFN